MKTVKKEEAMGKRGRKGGFDGIRILQRYLLYVHMDKKKKKKKKKS